MIVDFLRITRMYFDVSKLKIGSKVDTIIEAQINKTEVTGTVVFSNKFYDWRFANLSEHIASNFYKRPKLFKGEQEWSKWNSIKSEVEEKWGDENEKYNCSIFILESDSKYCVLKFVIRKIDKTPFVCLRYDSKEIRNILEQTYSGWDYSIGRTIEKFIDSNVEKTNRNSLLGFTEKYRNLDISNLGKTEKSNLIVFDIETKQFCENFIKYQKLGGARIKEYYPEIRVISCVYVIDKNLYQKSFYSHQVLEFLKLMRKFDLIISFNGKAFDLPVIQNHLGYKHPLKLKGTHVDILSEIHLKTSKRVSLDTIVKLNLIGAKKVKGRDMDSFDLEELTEACLSDVKQTYIIYRLMESNSILMPFESDDFYKSYEELPIIDNYLCKDCGNLEPDSYELESTNGEKYNLIACMNCLTLRRKA